jgi:xanthine dehydrogenase accessory factor
LKEFKTIVSTFKKIDFSIRKAALATVVKVHGSSYRSPGARMLITDDGHWVGSISGGCLEGDALRKARMVMQDKKAITVTYDTREESNQNLGIGLGCNGVIDVLIESVDHDNLRNNIALFEIFITSNEAVVLATVFNSDNNNADKILIDSGGNLLHTFTDSTLNALVKPDLLKVFENKKSEVKTYKLNGRSVEIFIELIQPAIKVIIFGGGFDARPVSELAKSLGWSVQVTDECVAHIAPIFFPAAEKLSLCQREFIDQEFDISIYTACVLMSHNYEYDRDVLAKILKTDTPYIGILGPQKRFEKMVTELAQKNIHLSSEDLHRIHAPIGLDIGAETPDEIALAIVSEIQSKFSNRSGGFLKYRSTPIHQRDGITDQVFKQVYINPDLKTSANN